jgi:hypothetical protein
MSISAKMCINLIDAGKLTVEQIVNPTVKAEVEAYYASKQEG